MKVIDRRLGALRPLAIGITCQMDFVALPIVQLASTESVILRATNYGKRDEMKNFAFIAGVMHRTLLGKDVGNNVH